MTIQSFVVLRRNRLSKWLVTQVQTKSLWFQLRLKFASRTFTVSICPSANELIAHGRDNDAICKQIGADELIFQTLEDLVDAVGLGNTDIAKFETSVFNGEYVTGDIDQKYLEFLESLRSDDAKTQREIQQELANLELHNEGA